MGASKTREKQLAMELYLNTEMLDKDIAEQVGVSAQTMVRWVKEGSWDVMKATKAITPSQAIKNAMEIYVAKSREYLDAKRAGEEVAGIGDELMKIAKSMEAFKEETSLRAYVHVLEEFMDFIPHTKGNAKLKQDLAGWQERFLRQKAQIDA